MSAKTPILKFVKSSGGLILITRENGVIIGALVQVGSRWVLTVKSAIEVEMPELTIIREHARCLSK